MADTVKLNELNEKRDEAFKNIQELRDAYHAQNETWKDAEQEQRFNEACERYDSVEAEIDGLQKRDAVNTRFEEIEERRKKSDYDRRNAPGEIPGLDDQRSHNYDFDTEGRFREGPFKGLDGEQVRSIALQGFFRAGEPNLELTEKHVHAMRHCRINPWQKSLRFDAPSTLTMQALQDEWRSHQLRERAKKSLKWCRDHYEDHEREARAMSGILAGSGGTLIPSTMVQALEVNMLAFGGLRQVAEIITTPTGEEMSWPTLDDTSNSGEQIGENTQQNDADPSTGAVKWGAYEYSSKIVKVPRSALTDFAVQLPSMLGGILGTRIGRVTSDKYTNGSGAGTSWGLLNRASLGKTAAAAGAITGDEILDLQGSIDEAYAANNPAFGLHKNVLTYVRKLKDGDGTYLWNKDFRTGGPNTLAGDEVFINLDMPSAIATGNKTITYGDHSKYKIRRVTDVVFLRLDERYAEFNQVAFLMVVREDGNLLEAGTAPVKYLQQA